jgi:hypothetical protein
MALAGCGTDDHVEFARKFANHALQCVAIEAPPHTFLSGVHDQRKSDEEARRAGFARNPAAPPVTPEETLLVKWPDGDILTLRAYRLAAEAGEALAYPAVLGDRMQRYGTTTTESKQFPTVEQQQLLRGCGL